MCTQNKYAGPCVRRSACLSQCRRIMYYIESGQRLDMATWEDEEDAICFLRHSKVRIKSYPSLRDIPRVGCWTNRLSTACPESSGGLLVYAMSKINSAFASFSFDYFVPALSATHLPSTCLLARKIRGNHLLRLAYQQLHLAQLTSNRSTKTRKFSLHQ